MMEMRTFVLLTTMVVCAVPLFASAPSYASCGVSITLGNNYATEISTILYKRKSRAGSWTNWQRLNTRTYGSIATNEDFTTTITTHARCGAKRRYRFKVIASDGNQWTQYYPSATGWTTTTELQVVLRP